MRRVLLALVLVASCRPPADRAVERQDGAADPGEGVVARVNGEPVTRAELDRMRGNPHLRRQLEVRRGAEGMRPDELERLALRSLVRQRLLLQEARRLGITVTDDELDAAVAALRRGFDDLASFGAWMRQQGLGDASLFEAVRADLTADRARAALVDGVRVTDEQARRYYGAHAQEIAVGEEVRLRIIAVRDVAAAEDVLAELRKGAPFRHVARERSRGLRAGRGGDTGWIDARKLPSPLAKAVAQLQPGDVGGPLEKAPGEILVVGLEGRRPLRARSLAEARAEIERRLLPAQQQEVVRAWLDRQESKAKIEVLTGPSRDGRLRG